MDRKINSLGKLLNHSSSTAKTKVLNPIKPILEI
jgi:hypothetical protein